MQMEFEDALRPQIEDRTDGVAVRMDELVMALEDERVRRPSGGALVLPGAPADEESVPGGGAQVPTDPAHEGDEVVGLAALTAILAGAAVTFHAPLDEACRSFDITTPLRLAHFLAQTAHESANYTALVENLNYGAAGLLATWPSRFDAARSTEYARQPERIANYVYAGRMGNGPEASGDGWRFRGRGILQVTGRATYGSVGHFLGVDLEAEPDLVATPRPAALAAGWYWHARGINVLCDLDDAVAVTEAVNGGRHGLERRLELLGLAKAALGGDVRA